MSETLASIRAVLSGTAERWARLMADLPEELLARAPAPGEWSAVECLRHMIDTEVYGFQVRVRTIRAGEPIAALDPDALIAQGDAGATPAEVAQRFASARRASLEQLADVQAHELALSSTHSELGAVTLGNLLNEWAAHDLAHTMQAERAIMQPFIAGCGPWRPYFAEHVIEG